MCFLCINVLISSENKIYAPNIAVANLEIMDRIKL